MTDTASRPISITVLWKKTKWFGEYWAIQAHGLDGVAEQHPIPEVLNNRESPADILIAIAADFGIELKPGDMTTDNDFWANWADTKATVETE